MPSQCRPRPIQAWATCKAQRWPVGASGPDDGCRFVFLSQPHEPGRDLDGEGGARGICLLLGFWLLAAGLDFLSAHSRGFPAGSRAKAGSRSAGPPRASSASKPCPTRGNHTCPSPQVAISCLWAFLSPMGEPQAASSARTQFVSRSVLCLRLAGNRCVSAGSAGALPSLMFAIRHLGRSQENRTTLSLGGIVEIQLNTLIFK